jgi:hypothetical protein
MTHLLALDAFGADVLCRPVQAAFSNTQFGEDVEDTVVYINGRQKQTRPATDRACPRRFGIEISQPWL